MHAQQLLHKLILTACSTIHLKRLHALLLVTQALIHGQRLSLTQLGRALKSDAYVKHNIKRVDRLLGNNNLQNERPSIYGGLALALLKGIDQPLIVVDWSEMTNDQAYQLLRASIPMGGRAFTVYEEVHPIKQLTNRKVHRRFLAKLKTLLPEQCCPIVITDAGFRATWFQMVSALGWDYLGRVRNRTLIKSPNSEQWQPCKALHQQATPQPQYLGHYTLVKSKPMHGHLYLVKHKTKGRHHQNRDGSRVKGKRSKKIAKGQSEPWLLVTSLTGKQQSAQRIIGLYKKRMQIEEAFRDIKSARLGLSVSESQTRNVKRLEILLLIGLLASWVIWLVGKTAEVKKDHLRYQSNTNKKRRVLSIFYLGCQVVKKKCTTPSCHEYKQAINLFRQEYDYACFI